MRNEKFFTCSTKKKKIRTNKTIKEKNVSNETKSR